MVPIRNDLLLAMIGVCLLFYVLATSEVISVTVDFLFIHFVRRCCVLPASLSAVRVVVGLLS